MENPVFVLVTTNFSLLTKTLDLFCTIFFLNVAFNVTLEVWLVFNPVNVIFVPFPFITTWSEVKSSIEESE